jgi:hypothetical protein
MTKRLFIYLCLLLMVSCSRNNYITGYTWQSEHNNTLDNIVFKDNGVMFYDLPSVGVYNIETTYKIDADSNGIFIGKFHYDIKIDGNELQICTYKYYR